LREVSGGVYGRRFRRSVYLQDRIDSPQNIFGQIRACVIEHKFDLEEILSLATRNCAAALKLANKGMLREGNAADILVLDKENLEIREVVCNGQWLFKNGTIAFKEAFLKESNRSIKLKGKKA
jgi:beta-aspartyl-dipeptidase (metallo-type)